jgi:hypothetical protein
MNTTTTIEDDFCYTIYLMQRLMIETVEKNPKQYTKKVMKKTMEMLQGMHDLLEGEWKEAPQNRTMNAHNLTVIQSDIGDMALKLGL